MTRDNKINKSKRARQNTEPCHGMGQVCNLKEKKGFTLIEVMVSVSLFAMVMVLSLGAIMSIIDGNKKAQAINAVANNLNFAVESMVRDIKTGYAYTCDINNNNPSLPDWTSASSSNIGSGQNGCTDSNKNVTALSLISTITGEKRSVRYALLPDPGTGKGRIYKTNSDTEAPFPVTSPEVDIQQLDFYVDNPVSNEGQPKVFLVIKGTSTINPTQSSDFAIQTLISQRNLNLLK